MRLAFRALALTLGIGLVLVLAAPAIAQEEPAPPKEEPAKTEPAKTEPAKTEPAKTEPAKEETAKPAAEEAPKAEAPKELSSCAKSLVPLAESYKKAYEEMQKWIAAIDSQTAAGNESLKKLQDQIQQNETAITKAKIDGDDNKAKELTKANKKLWDDLNAAEEKQSVACSSYVKEAGQRVKQYAADSEGKLKEFESGVK